LHNLSPFNNILKGGNPRPYIIVHCWYPDHLAEQVAKKYLELIEKYGSDESLAKTVVPVAVTANKISLLKR
jgi:hypothetical protein